MVEKNYELRKLCADDIFPMVNIISKIGIENMADCFDAKEMADIMNNLGKIKIELYQFLAGLSGMTEKEIAALPLGTFTQMIVDVFKKEEFSDFFQVVSGLLK